MKRMAMKYIEILIALGDNYFRQDTLEAIPLAIQMYVEASHIFGPQPVEIPQLGKRAAKTYNQLRKESSIDALDNATVDMELDFPFYVEPGNRGRPTVAQHERKPQSFLKTGYFCIPGNPYLAQIYNTIQDRLFKIRNGMDIEGRKRIPPLFEPQIDPGVLQRSQLGTEGVAGVLSDLDSPMPRYRFSCLIQQALDSADELQRSGQKLLSFKQQKDAEGLATLQFEHQRTVSSLKTRVLERRRDEVMRSLDAVEETRKQQEMRLAYFLALTGDSKQIPEPGQACQDIPQAIQKPKKRRIAHVAAADIRVAAQMVLAVPMLTIKVQPMGCGTDTAIGGEQLGNIMLATTSGYEGYGHMATNRALKAGRKDTASRDLQERRLEANTCGRELVKLDKDVAQLRARVATCEAEIEAQQLQLDNAAALADWLRPKYTGQELYYSLENSMGTLFHRTCTMAMEMAKSARRALDFEFALRSQSSSASSTLPDSGIASDGYWENSRDGQFSGEALFLDLKRMEYAYMEQQTHDFEIVETVSLRQINPLQLLALHGSGEAQFDVSEVLFNLDFPGHYCRRLSSVAVSMPRATESATSLSCTPFKDDSFRTDRIPITSIAVSTGVEDTGLFKFRSNDKYGPFEGAGAISSWRIFLPTTMHQFDYRSIDDIVLHLRYTAFDGGPSLANAASKAAEDWAQKQTSRDALSVEVAKAIGINLKSNYPSQWEEPPSGKLTLANLQDRVPFWARGAGGSTVPESVTLFTDRDLEENPRITVDNSTHNGTQGENGTLGGYIRYYFSKGLDLEKTWTVEMKVADGAKLEYAWLVVNYARP
ncbi:hypothetical protein BDV19DRAFT_389936 [Aspergillus venezuelensis]